MELIRICLDWVLILLSTYVLFKAVNRMVLRSNASIGNYAILITWAFCCLPILLDYLVGRPQYETVYWYTPFIAPMANDEVSSIYDLLILATIVALHFYCNGRERRGSSVSALAWSTGLSWIKPLVFITVVSPFAYVMVSGLLPYFLVYGDSGTRGMPEGANTMVTALLLLSVIAFSTWFFEKKEFKLTDISIFILYSFAVAWVAGKRFMIALLIIVYLYYYLNRDLPLKRRKRLLYVLPVLLCVLVAFSGFYLVGVRPLSDTSLTSVYEMLRVDFGRDDVTKYVIYHEFFLDDHLLDYPGQTFLSTFLVWVPRAFWPAKPFQHYQYLTSSILGLPISDLPAGTTPSWWEMSLANFSYIGYFVAIAGILLLVSLSDRAKTVSTRATALVLVIALMTQSIDAYMSLVLLLIAQYLFSIFIKRRKGLASESETLRVGFNPRRKAAKNGRYH